MAVDQHPRHALPAPAGAALPARSSLKGRRKAGVLLVALGSRHASQIFKHLRDDEIETLALEMAKVQHVEPSVTQAVLEELVERDPDRVAQQVRAWMSED